MFFQALVLETPPYSCEEGEVPKFLRGDFKMKERKLVRDLGNVMAEHRVHSDEEINQMFLDAVCERGDAKTIKLVNEILNDWENRSVKTIVKELVEAGIPVETVTNRFGRVLKKHTVMRVRFYVGNAIKAFRDRKWAFVGEK